MSNEDYKKGYRDGYRDGRNDAPSYNRPVPMPSQSCSFCGVDLTEPKNYDYYCPRKFTCPNIFILK